MRWKLRDNMISLRLSYYLFKNKKTWYFDTWKMKYYKKCHYYKKKNEKNENFNPAKNDDLMILKNA